MLKISALILALEILLHGELATAQCTLRYDIHENIGPATFDSTKRAMEMAQQKGCKSILAVINTPGGSLPSTRLIVESILNSPVPFLCLVAPAGAHAGSAGAIILQACHVNGAFPTTNLGAATPVSGDGQAMSEDLRKKILNDTRSWLEGLTRLRGRSEKFGQDIILEAKAVNSKEAKELGAIDWVGESEEEFLKFAGGRNVKMSASQPAIVEVGPVVSMVNDFRHKLVSFLTDPEITYILFMASLALLYYEITSPGGFISGVLGGMGLIVSLIAMHKLEVEWGGLLLMILGLGLLIAEVFVPAFGSLGLGGLAAFIVGSIFLYDPVKTGGYSLPLPLILPVVVALGVIVVGLGYLFVRTGRRQKAGGYDELLGLMGTVVERDADNPRQGLMELRGEIWRFESTEPIEPKSKVRVEGHGPLLLKVKPQKEV